MTVYINGVAQGGMIVHGAVFHTDITREIFLASSMGYPFGGLVTSHGHYEVVRGGANADEPKMYWNLKVPVDFVSFTKVEAVWTSAAAAGNMYWYLYANYAAGGEAYQTHIETPGIGATATGGANILNIQEPANPLTLANLALGDCIGIHFYRAGTNGLDTLDNAVDLYGILFTYLANQ